LSSRDSGEVAGDAVVWRRRVKLRREVVPPASRSGQGRRAAQLDRGREREGGDGAVLATVGLGFLSFRGGLGMSRGDLLTLAGALGFAAQIAATGFFAPRMRPAVLALTQIVAAAVLFVVLTPLFEHVTWDFGWQAWAAIVWTALSGTVFGFLVQAWAQKSTTSTRAGVILGLEGLFAAVFGLLFGLDVLSWRFAVGAALILAGVIVIETLPGRRGAPNPADALPRAD
jgi:drug/metabolite transporter (DMT)-like permease